jgi:thiamine biosynthesis lipoprotein
MPTDTLLAPAGAAASARQSLNGPTMGTRYAAVFRGADNVDRNRLQWALQTAVDEVDDQMSTWKPQSDLMRFNAAPTDLWLALPSRLLAVVAAGLEIGRLSNGAFDIASGDILRAWGFNQHGGHPDPEAVRTVAAASRARADELLDLDQDGGRLRKRAPLSLDLSGIAKGYGVDRLAEVLEAFGISNYIVSIDGEVRARGNAPEGRPWRVAVERPRPGTRDVAGIVELTDGALATSGNYRHSVEFAGRRYAHTMDPRTGRPVENEVHAVTVRALTCMAADAWATALLVLGPERGLPLAAAQGLEALYAVD